ncbi:hypothetical protein E5843_12075 [Luteimonas yindakuii]|uniref:hypothetical protein n=1 Tax=Luteimonas yindakuii TaxID=2565782 RepID=UPI0010A3FC35|nr:hypothetical protein [Luteimonas yindakuii]QCO68316.1 hypothetical protein E5843_12075 [Luteimonas yindakuii]
MRSLFHAALLSAGLLASDIALAQQAPPLQEQMTAAEFRAAGLDKLSADELAALNQWLQRRVGEETAVIAAQAREEGRKEVVEKNRGFFHFGSEEPIQSTIAGEFRGFGKGRRYTLANGQVWEQTDGASLAGVRRQDIGVRIRPGAIGGWWMQVDGYNTTARVERVE